MCMELKVCARVRYPFYVGFCVILFTFLYCFIIHSFLHYFIVSLFLSFDKALL